MLNFTSTRFSVFFYIFYGFPDIRVQKIAKITPPSKLGGSTGPIVLVREGSRFEANCNIHRNFHPNRSTLSWDIHWRTFSHRHTHVKLKTSFVGVSVLVKSGNVLSSTSNFWWYSNTSIRSTNMEVTTQNADMKNLHDTIPTQGPRRYLKSHRTNGRY